MSAARHAALLIRANAWLHRQRDLLADFEAELIGDVHDRVVYRGGAATEAEIRVIRDAVEAMEGAPIQDATETEWLDAPARQDAA